jgi:hypothetical protein
VLLQSYSCNHTVGRTCANLLITNPALRFDNAKCRADLFESRIAIWPLRPLKAEWALENNIIAIAAALYECIIILDVKTQRQWSHWTRTRSKPLSGDGRCCSSVIYPGADPLRKQKFESRTWELELLSFHMLTHAIISRESRTPPHIQRSRDQLVPSYPYKRARAQTQAQLA